MIRICVCVSDSLSNSYIIQQGYADPLVTVVGGIEQIHRCLTTMLMSDSQEGNWFCRTKKINYQMEYGCSFCNDTRYQMTDPERKSFQYPRSNEQLLELCGISSAEHQSIFHVESDVCSSYKDWEKNGKGYVSPNLDEFEDAQGKEVIQGDPHYSLTYDMYHAAKNTFQQLFASFIRKESLSRIQGFEMFVKIMDVFKMNKIQTTLTMLNWSSSGDEYVKQISLEIAPIALVKTLSVSNFICPSTQRHTHRQH